MPKKRISTKRLRLAIKGAVKRVPLAMWHASYNRRHATAAEKILVVRHNVQPVYEHAEFFRWLEKELPEFRAHFELRVLPYQVRDWSSYVLHACWANDRVVDWPPGAVRHATALLEQCDRENVPVINRFDRWPNATKSAAAEIIAKLGIRTPRTVRINDPKAFRQELGGLTLPILIREELGHGELSMFVASLADFDRVDFTRFRHPIGCEFIDVRTCDGYFRKYRFIAIGDDGIERHMMVNDQWEVRPERRIVTDALREEELAYLNESDPNTEALQRARRALDLDVIGFDYSYDQHGQMVIWEANAFPDFSYPVNPASRHIFPVVTRCFRALVRLYASRAGLPVPSEVEALSAPVSRSSQSPVHFLVAA